MLEELETYVCVYYSVALLHCNVKYDFTHRSSAERIHLLQQSIEGHCNLYYSPKTFLEPSFAAILHKADNSTLKVHNTKKTYACTVALHWEHSHSTHSAHAYRFHPISEDTKMVFTKYFAQGHSPSSAIHLHQLNLMVQHEGNEHDLEMALADRSVTPLPMDVYNLFRKWRYETHGDEGGAKTFDQLEELVTTKSTMLMVVKQSSNHMTVKRLKLGENLTLINP